MSVLTASERVEVVADDRIEIEVDICRWGHRRQPEKHVHAING